MRLNKGRGGAGVCASLRSALAALAALGARCARRSPRSLRVRHQPRTLVWTPAASAPRRPGPQRGPSGRGTTCDHRPGVRTHARLRARARAHACARVRARAHAGARRCPGPTPGRGTTCDHRPGVRTRARLCACAHAHACARVRARAHAGARRCTPAPQAHRGPRPGPRPGRRCHPRPPTGATCTHRCVARLGKVAHPAQASLPAHRTVSAQPGTKSQKTPRAFPPGPATPATRGPRGEGAPGRAQWRLGPRRTGHLWPLRSRRTPHL